MARIVEPSIAFAAPLLPGKTDVDRDAGIRTRSGRLQN
jgi:hypothetical protein